MARIKTKQHVREGILSLAVCDTELIGQEFEEGKAYLNVTKSFYDGEESSEDDVKHLLAGAKNANIVGKESIRIAKELFPELIINSVQGIPYAVIVRG